MNQYAKSFPAACVLALGYVMGIQSAELSIAPSLQAKLEPSALARRGGAKSYAYRVDAQPERESRLRICAQAVGVPARTPYDRQKRGYLYTADSVRIAARYDEQVGRYVCHRENRYELTKQSDFPSDLNTRAMALLDDLTLEGENYSISGMNAWVLQEPGGAQAKEFRRTFVFNRVIDSSVVLADEGRATLQFDRLGQLSMAEVPAISLTPCAIPHPLEPGALPERLQTLAAGQDTIHVDGEVLAVDSLVARAVARSFRVERRGGQRYRVPSQSVLVSWQPSGHQEVRREYHFTLDPESRQHAWVDPWLRARQTA